MWLTACQFNVTQGGTNKFAILIFQIDPQGTGMKQQALVDDIIKIVEDLTRIH